MFDRLGLVTICKGPASAIVDDAVHSDWRVLLVCDDVEQGSDALESDRYRMGGAKLARWLSKDAGGSGSGSIGAKGGIGNLMTGGEMT